MASQVVNLLAATLDQDAGRREAATAQLAALQTDHFPAYIVALDAALTDQSGTPVHLRAAAGIALKNAIGSREMGRRDELALRWRNLDEGVRNRIKTDSLATLAGNDRSTRTASAQVVAAVAAVELPLGLWNNLIPELIEFSRREDNVGLRQATLQAIGYVCEQIKPEILAQQSNQILTAVVQGARKEEPSHDVQLAAINALYNSLEFVKDNFEREGERNYIMQVVCEATQIADSSVQVAAFGCLVRIMDLFYDKMKFYMERALFGLTVLGMRSEDEHVALQAIEFWSTVCETEIDLALETEELNELDEPIERESSHFARIALPEVLPVLLQLLTKQDEDATDDEWNVSMASGTCLTLFAQCVGDAIVTPIIPFVESNIKSTDWHHREAAILAFGSILDGPDPKLLIPLVSQALPMLIDMVGDPNLHVKDTAAWNLGRVSDLHVTTIKTEVHLPNLINALVTGLSDSTKVASNCCWALMNLAEQLGEPSGETCPLSHYYDGIINSLLAYADRGEPNTRTSGYETCSALVTNAPNDCLPTISKLILAALDRSEQALAMQNQIVGIDDRNNYNELQSNLCGLLTSMVRRLGPQMKFLADRIMTLLLNLIQTAGKQSPILEDAFLCVGAVASTMEADFRPYVEAFLPYLHSALQSHEEYQLCAVAVGLIGDICRGLGEASLPYCPAFMEVLLTDLQSTVLHRSVKPPILSCFGDIAMAIGPDFQPFLETAMGVLNQAGTMRADPNNFDQVDYINSLREGMLESFTGIVGGFKSGNKADLLLPYASIVFQFLHTAMTDQDRTEVIMRSSIGLLGDLAEAFPDGRLKSPLSGEWISEALKIARTRYPASSEMRKVAKWSKEMIRRATH